jgi:hypothetical protein
MTQPDRIEENIRTLCAEAGFPLAEIRDDGNVLILVPEDLRALPEAKTLQHLADRIRAYEYRHVAFSVDSDAQ